MTRESMLIKNRSKWIKLSIKYNLDGIFIGELVVHLTRYLGVLARTMVPITYKIWHVVPKELKDKLWDRIESMLTVKYILPFKDQPKLLKRPPIKYTFIWDEEWTMFVKDRLSENFKDYREAQKERRKKHIYNHHLSRKGYAGLEEEMMVASGLTKTIDRSILWKKAREKKDGTFDEVPIPVIEKIVRKCELAMGTKENKVGGRTIILECGPNYLVVVDVPYDASAPLPIPIPRQTTTVGAAIGYQVLWPTYLVSIHTPILVKRTVNEVEVKSKSEKPQDIKNFEALVGLMLATSRAQPIDFLNDVFGKSFKTFLMKEDMDMIISSKEVSSNCLTRHLHRKLIDAKQVERYVFVNPVLVLKAGMGEGSKENRSRVIADRLRNTKHAEYMFIPYNPE
ncbi:hypothetical protein AAG906_010474 [Vitis piasezkii]